MVQPGSPCVSVHGHMITTREEAPRPQGAQLSQMKTSISSLRPPGWWATRLSTRPKPC